MIPVRHAPQQLLRFGVTLPPGWVRLNQQPLVISDIESETRWPEGVRVARELGSSTLVLMTLTAGNHRLGALGVSSVDPIDPGPAEIAFLDRVASEFAVAVEAFLAKQEAVRERDRLRTLTISLMRLCRSWDGTSCFPRYRISS
jgi:GAF domain-containing protein